MTLLKASDGFEMTPEDRGELERPLQRVGHFLIGTDARIRWARIEDRITNLPDAEELRALL